MAHLVGIILVLIFNVFHPFHVSISEFTYNKNESSLEITKKIFTDDLELAIKNERTNIYISYNNDSKITSAIQDYLRKKIEIKINEKPVKLIFIGYEIEDDAVWCYFQIDNVSNINSIAVHDISLFETYPDQVNLVHFNYLEEVKSFKLDHKNPEKEISF